jgi:hypothetical protein
MSMKRRILLSSPLVAVLIGATIWYAFAAASSPAAEPTVAATAEQQQAFLSLVQLKRRVFFEGWLTGDLSKFPEVYYNDSQYPPNDHDQGLINDHRIEIDALFAESPTGPIGAPTGELSTNMAEVLWRRGSSAAWEAAEAKAKAEGRAPTLKDMPDGQPPVMPVQPSDWVEKQIFIKDAVVTGGDHASFIYLLDTPTSPLFYHIDATNVNGHWYISKDWTTGNP